MTSVQPERISDLINGGFMLFLRCPRQGMSAGPHFQRACSGQSLFTPTEFRDLFGDIKTSSLSEFRCPYCEHQDSYFGIRNIHDSPLAPDEDNYVPFWKFCLFVIFSPIIVPFLIFRLMWRFFAWMFLLIIDNAIAILLCLALFLAFVLIFLVWAPG